jgi:hypothetical protein
METLSVSILRGRTKSRKPNKAQAYYEVDADNATIMLFIVLEILETME